MDSMYIPNNPQYGLQFEYTAFNNNSVVNINDSTVPCNGNSFNGTCNGNLTPCNGACGGECDALSPCPDQVSIVSPTIQNGGNLPVGSSAYWSTDDMGSFSLPPLDLDPLPALFPFSPCSMNNFKNECGGSDLQHNVVGATGGFEKKQPHDMADVLLSLKHAVVHPGQVGGSSLSPTGFVSTAYPQQPQLSYTVHPHQMLMSPSAYSTGFCDQSSVFGSTSGGCQAHQTSAASAMFPSMSVNVSMNMTMHGYPPPYSDPLQQQVTCPQMQWSTSPQNVSPVYQQNHQTGILNPNPYASGATYSFTADIRPSATCEGPLITSSSFKPVLSAKGTFSPLAGIRTHRSGLNCSSLQSPISGAGSTSKVMPGALSSEDESQRPNLCRICGKTYARPSTLKTHLRTHSGEKPYRCADCNKSFSQAANLTAHVRTHSGEKPFRCPICDRRFSQSSSVTTHMRTHSGERPYRCRMCKKAFSDSSTLTKHLRIHSGEKPYQCKLCLLRFSQSGNLNRHMRVHGTNNTTAMIG